MEFIERKAKRRADDEGDCGSKPEKEMWFKVIRFEAEISTQKTSSALFFSIHLCLTKHAYIQSPESLYAEQAVHQAT